MLIALPAAEAETALRILRALPYGTEAEEIGRVSMGSGVHLETLYGGRRRILALRGEGLPRIC